jgi:sulfoxide reductase heme-binding subunit YedZ
MRGPQVRRPRSHLSALSLLIHIGSWTPLGVLVYDFFNNRLTVNPIQEAEIRTGDIALTLLVLSLACTPLFTLLRRPQVIRARRTLGLYGYMVAAIHLTIFIGVDYGFDLGLIGQAIVEKPYIIVGVICFTALSLLALTSFNWWKARLKKNWKRLHRLVYAINLLVVVHFGWSVKGDFFRLRGDIVRPLAAGIIIIILLVFRLPPVRRSIAGQRQPEGTAPHAVLGQKTSR